MKYFASTDDMLEELEKVYPDKFPDMANMTHEEVMMMSGAIKLIRDLRTIKSASEKKAERKKVHG